MITPLTVKLAKKWSHNPFCPFYINKCNEIVGRYLNYDNIMIAFGYYIYLVKLNIYECLKISLYSNLVYLALQKGQGRC